MFIAPQAMEGGEFTLLEDGCYEAVIVGLRGFTGTKYQSDEPEDKMQFVFQVQDGDGVLHYLTTKPLTNVLNEKSNLFKVLSGVTGYGLDKFPVGFQYTQLVNSEKPVKCQLTVKTVTSKKDPNRQFNEIDGYLKAKKGQKYTFVPDDKAPSWLNQNVKEVFWIEGLSFLPPHEKTQASAKSAMPEVPSAVQLGNSSAFFGQQPQNPQNPQFAQPCTYVPPAAPQPQPVFGQAPAASPAPVADSESDLPF